MSQRKAKEYRRAMEQYQGVAADVDDLKRRIGAMEARHRREAERWEKKRKESMEQARRIREEERRRQIARRRFNALAAGVLVVALLLALAIRAMTADTAAAEKPEIISASHVAVIRTPGVEDPLEAEKIEAALLKQGYFSDAIPLPYDLQDIMRTACKEYGCPYPLALAVAEVESNFDAAAVGAVGEVGIMQLNPWPQNTYWVNLEAETGKDPTDTAGNIVCGVYLLGTHLANYEDTEKALMAYNMGPGGATQAWKAGTTSTGYTAKVMEAADRWAAVVG